jgi:hypothetical protein
MVRAAMWTLKAKWDSSISTRDKLNTVSAAVEGLGNWPAVEAYFFEEAADESLARAIGL